MKKEMNGLKGLNWLKVTGYSVLPHRECYLYIDSTDNKAAGIFFQKDISVRLEKEYSRDGKYHCIMCSIQKKDRAAFLSAMDTLANNHLLTGNTDYPDFCKEIMDILSRACA